MFLSSIQLKKYAMFPMKNVFQESLNSITKILKLLVTVELSIQELPILKCWSPASKIMFLVVLLLVLSNNKQRIQIQRKNQLLPLWNYHRFINPIFLKRNKTTFRRLHNQSSFPKLNFHRNFKKQESNSLLKQWKNCKQMKL